MGIFLIVEGALIVFIVRSAAASAAHVEGPDIHGSTRLETAWTIAPGRPARDLATFVFVNLPGFVDPAKARRRTR